MESYQFSQVFLYNAITSELIHVGALANGLALAEL